MSIAVVGEKTDCVLLALACSDGAVRLVSVIAEKDFHSSKTCSQELERALQQYKNSRSVLMLANECFFSS